MHLLVGLLTGTNAQSRLHAVQCLHELSNSPHPSVTPACLPATPYLLTYLSGQSTKFTVGIHSDQTPCNITHSSGFSLYMCIFTGAVPLHPW